MSEADDQTEQLKPDEEATSPATASVDLVVIGAGSGGEQLAETMAGHGWRVVVFEPGLVGGECPYVACVPSKSLLHDAGHTSRSWAEAVERRNSLAHDGDDTSHARSLTESGVDLRRERAELAGERRVRSASGEELLANHVVIATGASARRPEIPGANLPGIWTSRDALTTDRKPETLVIVGGGPVGVELAQIYRSYGTRVVLLQRDGQLDDTVEPCVSDSLLSALERQGIAVHLGSEVTSIKWVEKDSSYVVNTTDADYEADQVLLAVGVQPRTEDLGLTRVGVDEISVDAQLSVNGRSWLWAVGDVSGRSKWTHGATYQAKQLADTLIDRSWPSPVGPMPSCIFSHPPLARVGMTSAEAAGRGIDVVVGKSEFGDTVRSNTDEDPSGVACIVADRVSGQILGASIHGPRADDLVQIVTALVTCEATLVQASRMVFAFPTRAQVVEAAIQDACAALRR